MGNGICVIGAGPSGITAAKNVIQAGLGDELVVFEKNDQVGGNWVYRSATGHSSVYSTTHIISSKALSEYEDYPMPADYPHYPSHDQLREYFQDYARHFGVVEKVRFNTEVLNISREDNGHWTVRSRGADGIEKTETFGTLMVCNGHHWNPNMPEVPGHFDGQFLHSHDFKQADAFRDQRVLVIGGGNSAADIAVETARLSKRTCLSMRRGYWFLPKFLFGLPGDVTYHKTRWMPGWLRQGLLQIMILLLQGSNTRYGLQKPKHGILQAHPTVNSELLYFIGHGKIHPKVGIERFDGHSVHFTDGSTEDFDVIIAATGYKTTFPFFDRNFIDWEGATTIPLYRKMMHPEYPNLYFIGLFQPLGCIWPMADYQAKLAVKEILGDYQRPDDLEERIDREINRPHYAFVRAPRHAVEVDYATFKGELMKELKQAA